MVNFFPEGFRTLKGLFHASAAGVVLPAMIGAADAARLDKSVIKRGPAVRAVLTHQSVASALVAEQHQIFAKNPETFFPLRCAQLRGGADHVPVAPEQSPSRSTGTNPREQLVLFLGKHGIT